MKDSKFIELLNLYVDHQITAADAALLEVEIHRNPRRRQIYRQYCQMQKASSMLAENFRTDLPAPTDGAKIIKLKPERRPFFRQVYVVGSLAAAACVAAVVVLTRGGAPASRNLPNNGSSPTALHLAPLPVRSDVAALPPLQPAFPGFARDTVADTAQLDRPSFEWMSRVQLRNVSIDDLRFQTPATPLRAEDLTLRSRPPANQPSDYEVALKFVR